MMKNRFVHRVTRRTFIKGTGGSLGVLGLSAMTGGLTGCLEPPSDLYALSEEEAPFHEEDMPGDRPEPVPESCLLHGAEMVGRVTADSSTVRMVGGDPCSPSTQFRLLYDRHSRHDPNQYAHAMPAVSGFRAHDPINFELGSLSPGTRYYYRLGIHDGTGWSYRDERSFVTQRPPGSHFRFCIAADTHIYPQGDPRNSAMPHKHAVYSNIRQDQPDLLISMGDDICLIPQRTRSASLADPSVIWETTRSYRSVLDRACGFMSYLPVNGNHEGLFGWFEGASGYQEILEAKQAYFPVPERDTYPDPGDPWGRYGAFRWGDALFIWLDVTGFCVEDPWRVPEDNAKYILGRAQERFLQETLARNASVPWKFIFAHHVFGGVDVCEPGYGRGNANSAFRHDQAFIQHLMETYRVQAFFYGHDHIYSLSEANGVTYVCTGMQGTTGWHPWLHVLESCYRPYLDLAVDPNGTPIAGHVRVDVSPTEVTIAYIRQSPYALQNRTVSSTHTIHL